MSTWTVLSPALWCLALPSLLLADSTAYLLSGVDNFNALGSITPFHPSEARFGQPYFVPANGNFVAVEPASKQVWEIAGNAINILDPVTGATLASIPLTDGAFALIFDATATYAYAQITNAGGGSGIIKIDVASRTIVSTLSHGVGGGLGISADGTRLFSGDNVSTNEIVVIDTQSLTVITAFHFDLGQSFIVSGSTLCITVNSQRVELFDTATLKLIKTIALPTTGGFAFAISRDRTKIYVLVLDELPSLFVLDSSSGQVLLSQRFPTLGNNFFDAVLSPDEASILLVGNLLAVVDAATLNLTSATVPVAGPASIAFLDDDTVLVLYGIASALMSVDQTSAQLTSSIPFGTGLSTEVAGPAPDLIYAGGAANLSVFSTARNQFVKIYPVSFSPAVRVGPQLFSGQLVYNLDTEEESTLQSPYSGSPGQIFNPYVAAVPLNQATYWLPFGITDDINPEQGPILIASGIAVYTTAKDRLVAAFQVSTSPQIPIVFSPDSTLAYAAVPNAILVFNASTFKPANTFPIATTLTNLAISIDGSNIYGSDTNSVYFINAATGSIASEVPLPAAASGPMLLSPDGATLFVSSPAPYYASTPNSLDLINTATGRVVVVPLPFTPNALLVLPTP